MHTADGERAYSEFTSPLCASPTGTIVVNATGTGALEYSVDGGGNWSPTATFSGLAVGSYNIVVRLQSTPSCSTAYAGNPIILSVPGAPTAFTVTGGGAYCIGGTGAPVGLNGSQTGVNYQLRLNLLNTGAPVPGTGAAISFGNQTGVGAYTVVATNTTSGCTSTMTGSVNISTNALPTAFTVTGGGAYCSGGAGLPVGLNGSQAGVSYQLQLNAFNTGAPVPGTGAAISFGNQTGAGNYTVVATNATPCSSNMTGSVTITVTPTAFTVTGGGLVCTTDVVGIPVGLSGSQLNVNYQLFPNGVGRLGTARNRLCYLLRTTYCTWHLYCSGYWWLHFQHGECCHDRNLQLRRGHFRPLCMPGQRNEFAERPVSARRSK